MEYFLLHFMFTLLGWHHFSSKHIYVPQNHVIDRLDTLTKLRFFLKFYVYVFIYICITAKISHMECKYSIDCIEHMSVVFELILI